MSGLGSLLQFTISFPFSLPEGGCLRGLGVLRNVLWTLETDTLHFCIFPQVHIPALFFPPNGKTSTAKVSVGEGGSKAYFHLERSPH